MTSHLQISINPPGRRLQPCVCFFVHGPFVQVVQDTPTHLPLMTIATTDQVGREIDLWTVAVSKLDNLCMGEDSHLGEGGIVNMTPLH